MFGFRSQSTNGRIFSSDAGQWINISHLLPPQPRQFPLQTQMGMPQPFSSLGFMPRQQNFAAPPVQQQQFLQQQPRQLQQLQQQHQQQMWLQQQQATALERNQGVPSALLDLSPALPVEQGPQTFTAPSTPAPAFQNEVIELVAEIAQQPGTAPTGAMVEQSTQTPTITTTITAPVKRRRGRPSNASKGLPTKRPPRKPKSKDSACLPPSPPSPFSSQPVAKRSRTQNPLPSSLPLLPLPPSSPSLSAIIAAAAAPISLSPAAPSPAGVVGSVDKADLERQLRLFLAEADFTNPEVEPSRFSELLEVM